VVVPGWRTLLVDVLSVVTVQVRADALLPEVSMRPGDPELVWRAEDLQTLTHHRAELCRLVVVTEVETEDLLAAAVSPLVEVCRGLVVSHARS